MMKKVLEGMCYVAGIVAFVAIAVVVTFIYNYCTYYGIPLF